MKSLMANGWFGSEDKIFSESRFSTTKVKFQINYLFDDALNFDTTVCPSIIEQIEEGSEVNLGLIGGRKTL